MTEEERDKLWRKYGLSIGSGRMASYPEHSARVAKVHDAVVAYLEDHADVGSKWGSPGCRYFDIANLAVGAELVQSISDEAEAIATRRSR